MKIISITKLSIFPTKKSTKRNILFTNRRKIRIFFLLFFFKKPIERESEKGWRYKKGCCVAESRWINQKETLATSCRLLHAGALRDVNFRRGRCARSKKLFNSRNISAEKAKKSWTRNTFQPFYHRTLCVLRANRYRFAPLRQSAIFTRKTSFTILTDPPTLGKKIQIKKTPALNNSLQTSFDKT